MENKKRFYLEIEYDEFTDEEYEELEDMLMEVTDSITRYSNVRSAEIIPIGNLKD